MNRRKELEHIIVGTLLGDFTEYYPVCRNFLASDMFEDDEMRSLYRTMEELNNEGKDVDVPAIVERQDIFIGQDVARLCALATFGSFQHKKVNYNMDVELFGKDGDRKTSVRFEDYVNRLYLMAS